MRTLVTITGDCDDGMQFPEKCRDVSRNVSVWCVIGKVKMNKPDIDKLLQSGEKLDLECKRAEKSIPKSLWETYSAFANTKGGLILLGVEEKTDSPSVGNRFSVKGVLDPEQLKKDFWNTVNSDKVSTSIVKDDDVQIVEYGESAKLLAIRVPQAEYRQKPVYINGNVYKGTFKRNYEGGLSRARNPKMQNMFRMIGFGENIGSGFPTILDSCRQEHWEKPVLSDDTILNEVSLTLKFPVAEENVQEKTREEQILELLQKNNAISIRELAEQLDLTTKTIQRDLDKLKSQNLIRRVGPDKGGYWEIIEQ